MHRPGLSIKLIVICCMLVACVAPPSGESAAEAVTSTPTPVPTSTPRPTITPTIEPSTTPDVPLLEDGPWLVYKGRLEDTEERNSHLWVVNWDGTGLTDLLPDFWIWQYEVQPSINGAPGRYVAAITSYGWSDKFMFTLAHLPDGEVIANVPLTNPQTELIDQVDRDDPNFEDYIRRETSSMSISDLRSLAWSLDGTQIAFSGAQNGTQTDVYRYSLTDGSVSRLTQGQHPHHASNLLWSPDGRYIAYDDISGYAHVEYWADGIWAVRADSAIVKQVASEEEWPTTNDQKYRPQKLGWTSDHTIAVYAVASGSYRLKQVDVETGRSFTIFEDVYCGAAFAPEQDVWLVSTYLDGEVAYLIGDGVMNEVAPLACCSPIWSLGLNSFVTPQGLVSTDGTHTMLDLPKSLPLISPNGLYWAYPRGYVSLEPEEEDRVQTYDVLWIGEAGKQPQKLSDARFEVLQWSSNSRSVLVTNMDEGLQYVAIAPDFGLRLISQLDASEYPGPWFEGRAFDG